jgi:biotin transporter BioY
MLAGLAVIYVIGAAGLYVHFNLLKGTEMSLLRVWSIGVGPFVLLDLTKAVLASAVAVASQKAIGAAGFGGWQRKGRTSG